MRVIAKRSSCCSPPRRGPERRRLAPLLALAVLAAACGPGQRPSLFWNQDVQPHDIGAVAVMAAADDRVDRSIEVNLDAQLTDMTVSLMRDRGWDGRAATLPAAAAGMTLTELEHADAATIRRLATPVNRWVMVVGLVDVTTALTFGSTGNAEVAGYLFDTEAGVLLWRDRGVGQVGQGGLLGMALIDNMDEAAIATALEKMIAGLPAREPLVSPTRTPKPHEF